MKKMFLTLMVICLFTVGSAFAGWIHTTYSNSCNPAMSEPGTCIWVDDDFNHRAELPKDSESMIQTIKKFIIDNNPFDYFAN